MTITIHRGMNQIGGCITEIATSTTRILIDMGQNLPDGDGVVNDSFANKDVIKRLTLGIKAIFYTHCHGDHIGLFKYIPENVEQYIGETAKRVLLVTYKNRAFTPDIKDITPDDYHTLETFKTYTANNPVQVGDIKVTPYFVSHSACDAHMFLIEAGGKRVLHTGDFRGHGYLSEGLIPAIKNHVLKKPVDVLITSGHASADCLAEVCNLVNPTTAIIPIHGEQSEQYRKLQITDALKEKIITASCKKWKFDIIIREQVYEEFLHNLSNRNSVEYQPVEIINDTNEKIFTAVETGDVGKVKEALTKERINAASLYGYKSIVLAAERQNMDVLKMLLENGKNINRESFWSNKYKPALSALKTASCNGNIDVVKLLLEYGANAVTKDMDKALFEAISKNNIELLNILLEAGAKFQYPVIMSAIEKGNVEVVKILLKHRRSKLPKNDLTEAFIKALSNGNLEMVRFLLELGADVNEKDKKGFSAMMYAVENKDTAIVEMLKNAEKYSKKKKNLCKSVSSASSAY